MAGEQPAQFERTRRWEQIDSGGARPSGLTTEPFPFEVFNSQDIGPEKMYKARLGPPADVLYHWTKKAVTHIVTVAQTQHPGHMNLNSVQGATINHQSAKPRPGIQR